MTFATVATVLAVAGTGIKAIGNFAEGSYSQQVAKNNAAIAGQNADYALAAGQQNADTQARKNAAEAAALKVGQAASGVDVNSGSFTDVRTGQRMTGQLDAETVLNNAMLESWGYRTQQKQFEAEEKNKKRAKWITLGGDLLSGASSVIGGDFFGKQPIGSTAGGPSRGVTAGGRR